MAQARCRVGDRRVNPDGTASVCWYVYGDGSAIWLLETKITDVERRIIASYVELDATPEPKSEVITDSLPPPSRPLVTIVETSDEHKRQAQELVEALFAPVKTNVPVKPDFWADEPGELDRLRRYFATKWRSDDFA